MHIVEAAAQLRPGTAWNLRDGQIEQADDGTPRVDPPTEEELKAVTDAVAYQDQRRPEYPPLADQLDALWKGGDHLDAMKAQIQAVKEKYPKPQ